MSFNVPDNGLCDLHIRKVTQNLPLLCLVRISFKQGKSTVIHRDVLFLRQLTNSLPVVSIANKNLNPWQKCLIINLTVVVHNSFHST